MNKHNGLGGTIHQEFEDNNNVIFILAFSDTNQPYTCREWGEMPDGGASQIIYDQNSITTGKINFPIDDNVIHLKLKAWDNANNPSEKEIKLFRAEQNKLKIYNAFNFPNPFIKKTQFSFEVTQDFDLKFDVYSLGGRRIKSFEKFNLSAGFNILDWDGRDAFGNEIANGVYIYRLKVINGNSVVSYIGRCAKYQ